MAAPPKGSIPYRAELFSDLASAVEAGGEIRGPEHDRHVWMFPDAFKRLQQTDPKVLAAIRQQQSGCRGCGDSPLDGI